MSDRILRRKAIEAAAEADARRFLKRLKALHEARVVDPGSDNPKESGALRRASMDLTRALADLRRPL